MYVTYSGAHTVHIKVENSFRFKAPMKTTFKYMHMYRSSTTVPADIDIARQLSRYTLHVSVTVFFVQFLHRYTNLKTLQQNKPHIYSISDACFQALRRTGNNQCCVVSGESGAGASHSVNRGLWVHQVKRELWVPTVPPNGKQQCIFG